MSDALNPRSAPELWTVMGKAIALGVGVDHPAHDALDSLRSRMTQLEEQVAFHTVGWKQAVELLEQTEAKLAQMEAERDEARAFCRYEIEPGHLVMCPENHGSNAGIYDKLERMESVVETARRFVSRGWDDDPSRVNWVAVSSALASLDQEEAHA
jgi:hypothetical protein